jgi:hypothetical protein
MILLGGDDGAMGLDQTHCPLIDENATTVASIIFISFVGKIFLSNFSDSYDNVLREVIGEMRNCPPGRQ